MENSETNGQLKLHMDSQVLASDSSNELPEELRTLGVCAYDERTFQKGIMDQMGLQLAEFESSGSPESMEDDVDKAALIKRKLPRAFTQVH